IAFGYRHSQNERLGLGGNGFYLPERATATSFKEDTLRFSLTTIASEHAVNEFRVQASRRPNQSRGVSNDVAITVLDAFGSGGSQTFTNNVNRNLDTAEILTYTHKTHTFKMGITAEANQYENLNRSNFRGSFTFSSLAQYSAVLQGVPGARPTQFSINRGDPFLGFTQWEYGTFFQDDWKVSPKLTLSFGAREDFQTHLDDKVNISPRLGVVWAVNKKSNIRGGAGVFYSRLDTGITSDTIRFDGEHQQQFVIQRPDFFLNIPDTFDTTGQVLPTTRIKSEGLNAPYVIQTNISYERQLPKNMFASVSYDFFRGVHLLRLRNINAPTGLEDGQPILPFPDEGPILQYESTGFSRRHQLRVGLQARINQKINLFSSYVLGFAHGDTDGSGTTPANPYDLTTEYGRLGSDRRHSFNLVGSFTLPGEVRLLPSVQMISGGPFNITTGRDNNGDNQFSDRPAFAKPGDPGAIVTPFGTFNPLPLTGDQIIPRNFGNGPGAIYVNLGVSRTFGFGPRPNNFPGLAAANRAQQGRSQTGTQAQNERPSRAGGGAQNGRGGGDARGGGNAGGGRGGQGGGPTMMMTSGGGVMMMGPGGFAGNRHKYNLTLSINASN